MRQFMELQAVFALVILCGEVPSGLLSDLWGRKKTLLLGATLKAVSFSLLPLWSSYEGFLFYHLTMGIALSMISGGDVALLYDSYLASGGEKASGNGRPRECEARGANRDGGERAGGRRGRHAVLWASAVGERDAELDPGAPRAGPHRAAARALDREKSGRKSSRRCSRPRWYGTPRRGSCSSTRSPRGTGGLVMFWVNQKYWQESGVPLAWFGVLLAGYGLILGLAGRAAALASDEIRPATDARRRRRVAHRRVFRDGVVPRLDRDIARDPGPGGPGPGRRALPRGAQREDLLRVPRDRDLHGESGNPRLLLSPGPPRGLWNRPSGDSRPSCRRSESCSRSRSCSCSCR